MCVLWDTHQGLYCGIHLQICAKETHNKCASNLKCSWNIKKKIIIKKKNLVQPLPAASKQTCFIAIAKHKTRKYWLHFILDYRKKNGRPNPLKCPSLKMNIYVISPPPWFKITNNSPWCPFKSIKPMHNKPSWFFLDEVIQI